jgi:hypothetical protein
MSAQMATQPSRNCRVSMKGERNATIRAVSRFAAIAAKERRRKSASIQKHDCLFALFQTI